MELPQISKLLSPWIIAALSALPVLIFRHCGDRRQAARFAAAGGAGPGRGGTGHGVHAGGFVAITIDVLWNFL